MPKFDDVNGKDWNVNLNVGLIEDIKEETDIDLDELLKDKSNISELIFNSPRKIVEIIYIICKEQIERIPLTPREFARLFDRDTIDKASEAFLQAIILFYPRASAGKVLAERFPQLMKKMDMKIEKETHQRLDKALSDMDIVLPG